MSKLQNLYLGSAGQSLVMAEFLVRGYNVAVPEVDRGDDLFVVHDASGDLSRIQVKTSTAKALQQAGAYTAAFLIPLVQLQTPRTPELTYVLVVRNAKPDRWSDMIVIRRKDLYLLYSTKKKFGSLSGKGKSLLKLHVAFRGGGAHCSGEDLSRFRNDFAAWGVVKH